MQQIFDIFVKEWPTLHDAVLSVIGIALVCFAAGWTLGRFMGTEKLSNMQSRLERRDDEIAILKKTHSQSFEDAEQLAVLSTRLAMLEPWILSNDQVLSMRRVLLDRIGSVTISRDIGSPALAPVHVQTVALFREAGWTVRDDIVLDGGNMGDEIDKGTDPVELILLEGSVSDASKSVQRALRAAKIDFTIISRPERGNAFVPEIRFASVES